jgi:hypothetical protein
MPNVVGVFDSAAEAHSAVQQVVNSGFDREQISLLSQNVEQTKLRDTPTGITAAGQSAQDSRNDTSGALKGAGIGAALGGLGGVLAGIISFAVPVVGSVVAAGPIAAALAGGLGGAGLGAAAGGLIGALTDLGIPEEEATHYQEQVGRGKTLVVVNTADDAFAERAADILELSGAASIAGRDLGGEPTSYLDNMQERQVLRDEEPDATDWPRETSSTAEHKDASERIAASHKPMDKRNSGVQNSQAIPVPEEQLGRGKSSARGERVRIYTRETVDH